MAVDGGMLLSHVKVVSQTAAHFQVTPQKNAKLLKSDGR